MSAAPAELRKTFDIALNAWKDTWFRGGLAVGSNPHARAVGKEIDAFIVLGPGISVPVVEKLADPENSLPCSSMTPSRQNGCLYSMGPTTNGMWKANRSGFAAWCRCG
jgi:hypothetical protein